MGLLLISLGLVVLSFIVVAKESKHFLGVLIGGELLLLSMLGLTVVISNGVPVRVISGVFIIILCFGVCDSCMGLGVLISMGREKGGSEVYGLRSFKV